MLTKEQIDKMLDYADKDFEPDINKLSAREAILSECAHGMATEIDRLTKLLDIRDASLAVFADRNNWSTSSYGRFVYGASVDVEPPWVFAARELARTE